MKIYLKNSICKFTPLFDINYEKKTNIISCCFFKMQGGGYKDFSIYLNGIKYLNDFITEELSDFYIRLFIDKSIYIDNEIMKYLKKLKKLQIVLTDCKAYKKNNVHHRGLMPTFFRFFPMFNFENNDSDVVLIADIDWKSVDEIKSRYTIVKTYKLLKKKKKIKCNVIYYRKILS